MSKSKSSIVLVSVLAMTLIWSFIFAHDQNYLPAGLELFIFLLIMIAAVYSFVTEMKKHKAMKEGFPAEDELSQQIKYRAGYLAFMTSIYIWLALFLLKEWFTDYDTLFGIGLLLPAVIFMGIRVFLSRNYDENAN